MLQCVWRPWHRLTKRHIRGFTGKLHNHSMYLCMQHASTLACSACLLACWQACRDLHTASDVLMAAAQGSLPPISHYMANEVGEWLEFSLLPECCDAHDTGCLSSSAGQRTSDQPGPLHGLHAQDRDAAGMQPLVWFRSVCGAAVVCI